MIQIMQETITHLATEVLALARKHRIRIVTAESCTGGLIIGTLTDIPGSSDVVDRGFITYSNAAKIALLDVPAELIASHGAVSEEVAITMAEAACHHSHANDHIGTLAIAVTGIAGPNGGSDEKPVGTVWFGLSMSCFGKNSTLSWVELFSGNRNDIRKATVHNALTHIRELIIGME